MIAYQALGQEAEGLFGGVGELKEVLVFRRDRPGFDEVIHVQNVLPIARTVHHDGNFLGQFAGLIQGKKLEHLVQRAEASGKDD